MYIENCMGKSPNSNEIFIYTIFSIGDLNSIDTQALLRFLSLGSL